MTKREEADMSEQDQGADRALESPSDAKVTKSIVGIVRGRDVHLTGAAAGLVAAGGSLSVQNGGCGPVLAIGGVTIRNGGCGPLIANGDVTIQTGGTQAIVAAGRATVGPRAFVGAVISPNVTVEEGGRVLVSSPMALAVGAGAGVAAALLLRLFRR
jgi:hypothetical protein